MIHQETYDELRQFRKSFKPDHVIHLGDVFDLRALRNGASAEEKQEGISADVEAGLEFINWLKPDVLLWGNHDQRLFDAAENTRNAMLSEYCLALLRQIEDRISCHTYPYDKRAGVYEFGDYRFVHGVNANLHAAYKAASHYGNVVMGHVHTSSGPTPFPTYDGSVGFSCGMIGQTDMKYNRGHANTLRHNNGWMYGVLKHGKLDLHHMRTGYGLTVTVK
jgi:predicted phosphodiesterase